jgi:hypothetical protein
VAFDRGRMTLRHCEVQLLYDAAFLYWGVAGVLAERWGHGPTFAAYSFNSDRLLLSKVAGDNTVAAICGLKGSAFSSEETGIELSSVSKLALQWLSECAEVLRPRHITRAYVKIAYSYPIQSPERVAGAIFEEYPAIREFPIPGYADVQPGITFHARSGKAPYEDLATGMFGVYGPDQAPSIFQTVREQESTLGLVYDLSRKFPSNQFDHKSVDRLLRELMEQARRDSWDAVTRSLMRVMGRV